MKGCNLDMHSSSWACLTSQGAYLSIYDDDSNSDWQDENKGGGALLAYGATTVVFSDTAVFK